MARTLGLAVVGAAWAVALSPVWAQEDRSQQALQELAVVERAFSARSQEVGPAQAWREYADVQDGMLFGSTGEPAIGPDNIYAAMGGDAPAGGVMTWVSERAWAARSGDMASSWGRWTFRPDDPAAAPLTGRYVSVWRKDAAGAWKVLIDIGNSDRPPSPIE